MTGLTNFASDNVLNYLTGQIAMPALPAVYLALFTAVGTDAGTGFTEVTGGAYARQQVAGSIVTNASTTTSSPTIGAASIPSWIQPGMTVYDPTNGNEIGTIAAGGVGTTTLTLTANAAHAVASGDTLNISAFAQGSGTAPSSTSNGSVISFPQATANWGTVVAFGLYDAVTGGNLLVWDYLGNFQWQPATISANSPAVITAHANGIPTAGSFVFSTEYGGTAPTFSAGNLTGIQTASSVTTDTVTVTGVNTSTTGNGMIRQVTQQSIPTGVSASFAASTVTLTIA
jgi:hypothetical protein